VNSAARSARVSVDAGLSANGMRPILSGFRKSERDGRIAVAASFVHTM
jgi:hypothetical protein